MSFPRYPKYKPSGVEWLGELPAHWEVTQSRRVFACRNERAHEGDEQLTASQEYGVITQAEFIRLEGRRVVEVIKGADILKHVEPNDFVISMRSFQGGLEWSRFRGCISSAYVMLSTRIPAHEPFFAFLFKCQSYIQALQSTTNLVRDGQALRYHNFTQVPLPTVPLPEQRAIAAFLDRETEKIDALVAEQEKLIELLAEKRQAVISHAVTKGLNPNAPMKPSGVEWLGDVPAHWTICPAKRFIRSAAGGTAIKGQCADEPSDGLFPAFSASGQDVWVESPSYEGPALVLSAVGARCGKTFRADGKWGVVANTHCLFPLGDADRDFLWWLTNDESWWEKGGSAQPFVKVSDSLQRGWTFPPVMEQRAIAAFLAREAQRIDALVKEAQSAITLLRERRAALISAAVTGQIDVRHIAPESAA